MSDQTLQVRTLSTLMKDLANSLGGKTTSIAFLLEAFHERGIGVMLFLFAAPMALPLPVPPGINIILATPLLLLTAQLAIGRHTIWMPKKIQNKNLDTHKLKTMLCSMIPILDRIQIFIKPRFAFMTQGTASRFMGTLGVVMALTVCIPLPLTNTVPSLGIALMAIGITSRDGLAVLAGALIGMAWVLMLIIAVAYFGPEAYDMIKSLIKGSP